MKNKKIAITPSLVVSDDAATYRRAGVLNVDIKLAVECPKCKETTVLEKADDEYIASQIMHNFMAQAKADFQGSLHVSSYGLLSFELILLGNCNCCDNEIFATIAPLEVAAYNGSKHKKYKFIMGSNPGSIEWDGNVDNQPEEVDR